MSIIAYTDLKTFLNIATADTTNDTLLTAIAARACGIVEEYLCRTVEAATYTDETHDGGDELIIVKHRPLNSVSSITDWLSTLVSDQYTFYVDSGIVQLYAGKFANRANGVKITYNGGWATVPSTIKEACNEIGVLLYKESGAGDDRLGKSSISAPQGGGTLSYIRQLSTLLLASLERYKEVAV
jgi:hypothetical protein